MVVKKFYAVGPRLDSLGTRLEHQFDSAIKKSNESQKVLSEWLTR